jgi:UDP-N-acetylglucosamine 2-epimerase (non-hydrolysing)
MSDFTPSIVPPNVNSPLSAPKLKVMTVLGTRPEIIRLAAVIKTLEQHTNHVLVHTGQNYDYDLNQVFFDDLGVSKPNYFLNVDTSSLGHMLGELLIRTEEVILKEKPDAFLVLGDTNSAVSLIMAKRMKIPTYHMEAGNRSFDPNVPEEANRRLVDHLADFNLVYTEHARRHLLSEGLPHRFVYLTGSPMREVLMSRLSQIAASDILQKLHLERGKYFIVSAHREENVDKRENLEQVVRCLECLHDAYGYPVVVSTHPRTRNRLEKIGLTVEGRDIRFLKPFGFLDYNKLQMNAFCAVSDSGTISEESAILDFPAVTIRNSLERPEALDAGSIMLTGLDPDTLLSAIKITVQERDMFPKREIPEEYKVENTSLRVVKLIVGTAKLAHRWLNMDTFSRYDWL